MVIVLSIVFLIAVIIGLCMDWDEIEELFIGGFVVCLAVGAILLGLIINGRTLDSKIQMYTEENQKIEENIDVLVKQYMDYETDTFGELKNESSITLVSLYPELKANTLVDKQISIYAENNINIKRLKEKTINISNYKWWLYFGR